MLILAAQKKIPTVGVEIETVYLDGNASSHFNPLLDSMRIYFVFARFLSSSFFTAVIDYLVFSAVYHMSHSISGGILAGRLLAGAVNFTINRSYVFHLRSAWLRALIRYASLVALLGCIAYVMIDFLVQHNGWNAYVAKITVEGLLLMASFVLQREVVFADKAFEPPSEVTDWDAYYAEPFIAAPFTRRITARLLERLIRRFAPGTEPLKIMELGGANSCFHDHLTAALHPSRYDIADNNQLGLQAFREKVDGNPSSVAHNLDVLSPGVEELAGRYDVCFSVGLVEHFDPVGTARSIASHLTMLRPGGLAIITYPTPTWLYRMTRFLAESTGQWTLWDERPLLPEEVMQVVQPLGEVLHTQINWKIFLTQGVVVVRKPLDPASSSTVPAS
jgi:putative flippase GtrA